MQRVRLDEHLAVAKHLELWQGSSLEYKQRLDCLYVSTDYWNTCLAVLTLEFNHFGNHSAIAAQQCR